MNINDLQDDEYDNYDDYGDTVPVAAYQPPPANLSGYTAQASTYQQPSTTAGGYKSPRGEQQPAQFGGFGRDTISGGGGGGLDSMSNMAKTLPAASPPAAASSKYGGGDKCPRCLKTVYFAEAKEGPNNIKYHKTCFTCMLCRKILDSTFSERQGDMYCKVCYGKEFGPKGFGFGSSVTTEGTPSPESRPKAATYNTSPAISNNSSPAQKTWNSPAAPSMTAAPKAQAGSTSPPSSRFGGGDKCGRCAKTVYFAEAREGPGNIKYHKACFACMLCNKTLDSHFAERKGDLYCKPCYAREYGPSGFGFAGVSSPPPANIGQA